MKFDPSSIKLTFRLADIIGLNYHNFTFRHEEKRKKSTIRSWFPGYFFVETDLERDYWQQLLDVPGVHSVLGSPSPLPPDEIERLKLDLPFKLKNADGVKAGARVLIMDGAFRDHEATVSGCDDDGRNMKVVLMAFGRPTVTVVKIAQVRVLS